MNEQAKYEGFVEHYARHQRSVFGYVMSLVPNAADAEELFQETNVTLLKKWEEFDPERPFLPWAYAIAHNHVRNHCRKKQRLGEVALTEETLVRLTDKQIEMDEVLEVRSHALEECLANLDRRRRRLIEQCYFEGNAIQDVAKEMGMATAALYSKLYRIRKLLLQCVSRRLAEGSL